MPENTPNPFAAQKFEGPFSGAITPQMVEQPHQSPGTFSGTGGRGEAVTGLLSKFLAGVGQGRAQKSMAQEAQKYQFNEGFSHWANGVMRDQNVPEELKGEFEKGAAQAQAAEAAAATKDHKDHPILGALHKVFSGMAGGETTKSKSDIPAMQKFMAEWNAKLNLPQNTVPGQQKIFFGQAQQAVAAAEEKAKQSGQPFTKEDAAKVILPILPKLDQLWGARSKEVADQILAPFDKAKTPPSPDSAEGKRLAAEAAYANAAKAQQQPPAPGAQPSSAPPAAGSGPATQTAPPAARTESPTSDKTAAPPPNRPTVIIPEALPLLRSEKLIGKPEERIVNGETKPRLLYPVQPHKPASGPEIPGGMLDMETREVFKSSDTEKYDKPAKPTAKEADHDKKAEARYRETHKIPEGAKLTATQDAQADKEYAAFMEPDDVKKQRALMSDLTRIRIAKDLEESGASKKFANQVSTTYANSMKTSGAQLQADRERAQAAFEKALGSKDSDIKASAGAERAKALQDAWDAHKTRLGQAVSLYDQQRGDGQHDPWVEKMPEKVPTEAPPAARGATTPTATPPDARKPAQSETGKKAATDGYIVGRKYAGKEYLGGPFTDAASWK